MKETNKQRLIAISLILAYVYGALVLLAMGCRSNVSVTKKTEIMIEIDRIDTVQIDKENTTLLIVGSDYEGKEINFAIPVIEVLEWIADKETIKSMKESMMFYIATR